MILKLYQRYLFRSSISCFIRIENLILKRGRGDVPVTTAVWHYCALYVLIFYFSVMKFFYCIGLSRTQEGFEALDCAQIMDAGQTRRCFRKYFDATVWSQTFVRLHHIYCAFIPMCKGNKNLGFCNMSRENRWFLDDIFVTLYQIILFIIYNVADVDNYFLCGFCRPPDPALDPTSWGNHSPSLCSWGTV